MNVGIGVPLGFRTGSYQLGVCRFGLAGTPSEGRLESGGPCVCMQNLVRGSGVIPFLAQNSSVQGNRFRWLHSPAKSTMSFVGWAKNYHYYYYYYYHYYYDYYN